jgi:hypothetical protein
MAYKYRPFVPMDHTGLDLHYVGVEKIQMPSMWGVGKECSIHGRHLRIILFYIMIVIPAGCA